MTYKEYLGPYSNDVTLSKFDICFFHIQYELIKLEIEQSHIYGSLSTTRYFDEILNNVRDKLNISFYIDKSTYIKDDWLVE